jgi:hypothetical protein
VSGWIVEIVAAVGMVGLSEIGRDAADLVLLSCHPVMLRLDQAEKVYTG